MPDGNKVVSVPGVGNISFPGTMDDAAINQAISQHLAAMKPGAMQSSKGGPITNARSLTPASDTGPTFGGNLGEAALGAVSGLSGAPETQNPLSDMWQNQKDATLQDASQPFWKRALKATFEPQIQAAGIAKNLFGAGKEMAGSFGTPTEDRGIVDSRQFSHGLGSLGGQFAGLGLLGKTPEAVADPVGKTGFQNIAREVINEGPSKARVLADQHAHALELQKHVAGVADAVHQDAQQAMSQVSQAVDAAKPEGAFDKTELRDRLKTAMGDTLEDEGQLPTSLKKLTTTPKPTFASFVNKNTQDFIGRLKQGGLANDEIAQAMKEQGFQPGEIKAALGDAGTTAPGKMSFEEVKQARSDLGRQLGRLQGPAQAAGSAAYGELSKVLREGARDVSQEPQWIDANAKWKGYLDDFHRSPIAKTLAGENASDIMDPLTGKSRVQTLDILSKYEPFGINMDKINQEVSRSGAINTVQKLSRPTKMDLIIAKLSPGGAALRSGVPRMLRNPAAADFLGGKGFEPENISPKKVYPNKAAAAAALKGKGPSGGPPSGDMPRGNPTSFGGGGGSDAVVRNEVLKESLADAEKKLKSAKGDERGIIQRQIADFRDMLGETP